MRVVVIGGVAAGMSAASKIKRMDPKTDVVVYEKGSFLSYGACGLPYYVGGLNDDYKKMIARTEEQFNELGITTHLHHEVMKVIPTEKKLLVRNHHTGDVFIDYYDKLLISTGAQAIVPTIEGANLDGTYVLKTLEDGLKLKEKFKSSDIQRVVVVGGGYIGIEMVDALLELGKHVTCIEFSPRILMPFEPEISDVLKTHLIEQNVVVKTNERVMMLKGRERVNSVVTDKDEYPADLVIFSIGVKPATQFIKETNIQTALNGALIVDREMRTSISDIYAAGDCAVVYHKTLKENTYLPLGTVANKCGRIAGENIMGKHTKFIGALGSAGIKVGHLEAGRTGLSEADAIKQAIDYKMVVVSAYDHPGYYPNPTPIKIKLIYEANTKVILGAQAVGHKGAVLRIDMFAIAIQNKMTTNELGMTDLIYAPPFAGVWDAVHIACNAAK